MDEVAASSSPSDTISKQLIFIKVAATHPEAPGARKEAKEEREEGRAEFDDQEPIRVDRASTEIRPTQFLCCQYGTGLLKLA